jgi:hypothetical protein
MTLYWNGINDGFGIKQFALRIAASGGFSLAILLEVKEDLGSL